MRLEVKWRFESDSVWPSAQVLDSATIIDWAYQTEPNVPIHAGEIPEPGCLGMLALGAVGVMASRKMSRREARSEKTIAAGDA